MSNPIQLFRKRLIPEECIQLKEDEIIKQEKEVIITKWKTLKPRKDFTHGVSCYFLKKGIKVSKFIKGDGSLFYWYCDIIKTEFFSEENKYIFTDLLADVIIMPDGFVKVVDLDELAIAAEQGLVSILELKQSLFQLNELLELIYSDNFKELQRILDEIEEK